MTVLPCLMYARDSGWVLSVWLSEIYGSRIRCPVSRCGRGLVTILPVNRSWVTAVLRLLPSFLFWQSWSGQGSTQQPLANWDWIKSTLECVRGFGASPECVCSLVWLRIHMWCQTQPALPAPGHICGVRWSPCSWYRGPSRLCLQSHTPNTKLGCSDEMQPGIQREEIAWGMGYVFKIFKNFSREWRKRDNKGGLKEQLGQNHACWIWIWGK